MNSNSINTCPIDSYFNYENYLERLKEGALEKKEYTGDVINEKSRKILENIKPLISIIGLNQGQHERIERSLLKISKTRPGRKLLKQIIKNGHKIQIIWDEFYICCCSKEKDKDIKIYLNSNKRYYHILSSDGKFQLTSRKGITSTLFHELVHCYYGREMCVLRQNIKTGIVQHMDNANEQITITGIDCENPSKVPNPVSENGYLLAAGRPLRISHHGLSVRPNADLTPLDKMLLLNEVSPETAKEFIETELPSLSKKMSCGFKGFGNYSLTPLEAACYFGEKNLMDFLLENHIQKEVSFDPLEPFWISLRGHNFSIAGEFAKKYNISEEEIKNKIFNWAFMPTKLDETNNRLSISKYSALTSLFETLGSTNKIYVFWMLLHVKNHLQVANCMLHSCRVDEIDSQGNNLMMAFIDFLISYKNKPLNYGYVFMWDGIKNKFKNKKECLSLKNNQGETALSLADKLKDAWLIQELKQLQAGNIIQDSPYFGNLFLPETNHDFSAYYDERTPIDKK